MKHRIVSLFAALGLLALFIPATTGLVAAWSAPDIASVCSNDAAVHNWTVTLTAEADFNIQWADNAGFVGATDVVMHVGANAFQTPSTVTTLYVRWASDTSVSSFAAWNGGTCNPQPTPTPTAPQLPTVRLTFIKMICPSYTVVPANKTPTVADATGGHGAELDTNYQTSVVNPATDLPQACHRADGWSFQMYSSFTNGILSPAVGSPVTTGADGAGTGSATITLDANELATVMASGSPAGLWVAEIEKPNVAGFGALRCIYCIAYNVAPTADATPTPFESFQGETATPQSSFTPPPTSTGGNGTGGNTAPLLALLISVAFGALGLLAVGGQRRTSRR